MRYLPLLLLLLPSLVSGQTFGLNDNEFQVGEIFTYRDASCIYTPEGNPCPISPSIDSIATFLKANRNLVCELSRHTDGRGTNEYNLKFSEREARANREAMIQRGVWPSQLTAIGYGEERPLALEKTIKGGIDYKGRDLNRRFEMKIIDTDLSYIERDATIYEGGTVEMTNFYFKKNTAEFQAIKSSSAINEIKRILNSSDRIGIQIGGYMGPGTPANICERLSFERAQAVVNHLISIGVSAKRLEACGYGFGIDWTSVKRDENLKDKIRERLEIRLL